jgi:hypothetical protein
VNLSQRDRRALLLLVGSVLLILVIRFWPQSSTADVSTTTTIPQAERRLRLLRQTSQSLPAREQVRKKVAAELEKREKGLIRAETAAQAEAQMLEVVRKVLRAQTPPVEFRGTELGEPRNYGDHYGEVTVTISLECGIEQIVNLLADLGNQPEAIATSDITFTTANAKTKTVPVRITLSALVPRRLVPQKREGL